MGVQRKRVVRATDAILRGEDPGAHAKVLLETGWLQRKNGSLTFGPPCGDVIGVSVNRESIEWVVAGVGDPLASGRLDCGVLPIRGKPASPPQLEEYLTTVFKAAASHLPNQRVAAVGVAWPAPIAPNGEPRDYPFHHAGRRDRNAEPSLPLTPIVHSALGAAGLPSDAPPVAVVNDVDADMLYELRFGVAKGANHVMGLKVCGGIGMTLVHEGQIVRGGSGTAGEVEHIRVRFSEVEKLPWDLVPLEKLPKCPCTGEECVGRFATGAAIIEQLANYFDKEKLTPNQRGRRIQAEPTDAVISDVCGRAGSLLGEAILAPVLAFDPEMIVVRSFPRSDALVDAVRTKLTKGTAVYLEGSSIVPGSTGAPITAIGAAQLAIEQSVVPEIDRRAPDRQPSILRRDLPAWLRQRIPPEANDICEVEADYGRGISVVNES